MAANREHKTSSNGAKQDSFTPLIVLALGFVLLTSLLFMGALRLQTKHQAYRSATQPTVTSNETAPLPAVAGVDQAGVPWATTDMTGSWTLMFFGYTSCPDVCPQTMVVLDRAYAQLAATASVLASTRILMVSVDPAVDTPERLSTWLGSFDPALTAVRLEDAQLKTLASALGIHIMPRSDHEAHNHRQALRLIDHTPTVLIVGPDLRPRRALSGPHTPSGIVAAYLQTRDLAGSP